MPLQASLNDMYRAHNWERSLLPRRKGVVRCTACLMLCLSRALGCSSDCLPRSMPSLFASIPQFTRLCSRRRSLKLLLVDFCLGRLVDRMISRQTTHDGSKHSIWLKSFLCSINQIQSQPGMARTLFLVHQATAGFVLLLDLFRYVQMRAHVSYVQRMFQIS